MPLAPLLRTPLTPAEFNICLLLHALYNKWPEQLAVPGIFPVVLGLIPNAETDCAQNNNAADPGGSHWREFVELWGDHGVAGDVCEPSYVTFFQDAVAIID